MAADQGLMKKNIDRYQLLLRTNQLARESRKIVEDLLAEEKQKLERERVRAAAGKGTIQS